MASQTRLISGGITYYLAGGGAQQVPYAGSATPWTVQTTTPFELSLNDDTGSIYTPAPAPSVPILGGGPPFRVGRSLITKSYDTVTESVGVQLRATSLDNAVALLRLLRQILNTALFDSPCILAVQPDGTTNATYFEILYADVPEKPDYLWETTSGACLFRVTVTWVRSIGSAGALTTLINAVSIRNRSTSSPDDVESLGTPVGDLIYEGQPLNVYIKPTSGDMGTLYLATVLSRTNIALAESKTTTTFSLYTTGSASISTARTRGLKVRILGRFDTFTAPSKVLLSCSVKSISGGLNMYTSPLLSMPNSAASATLIDFGGFDASVLRSIRNSGLTAYVQFKLTSSDGTSVTARVDYCEVLLYYTFAVASCEALDNTTTTVFEQANDYNVNGIVVPNSSPRAYGTDTTSGENRGPIPWRGSLPRAYSGASIYAAWLGAAGAANGEHDTTDTADLSVLHLPIAHTLR